MGYRGQKMTNQYIQNLIRQYILDNNQNNEQYSLSRNIDDYNNKLNSANKIAQNVSNTGNFIDNNFANSSMQKLGSTMTKAGDTVANGVNTFKGFATKPFEALASKLGTGAATTAATTGGTVAGSTAGATAAGAGAGTAAGSAAGGAAAGGSSAASGAAAGGPIGAVIAAAIMAAMGTNRKRAKKSGQALMNSGNEMAEGLNAESEQNLAQLQQNNAVLQQQANQALSQGIVTGGAAPIQNNPIQDFQNYLKDSGYSDNVINGVPQGLNYGNQEVADWINQYNNGAGKSNPIRIPLTQEDIIVAQQGNFNTPQLTGGTAQDVNKGWLDKLANGIADFALGYNENRNNGFTPDNLTNNKFVITKEIPNMQLQNYQQNLLNEGKYTPEQVKAISNKKNSGSKEIAKWIEENPQAYNPTTTETTYKDKSKMGRFGEFAGTVGRIVQNPTTQALIAGGLSTVLTGNPLYGLGMAYKFGNGRAMSDIYSGELAKQGVEVNPGMWGSLTSSDMNALMMPQYKQTANDILKARLDESARYHDLMMKYYNDKLEETKSNNKEKIAVANKNANARQLSANASMVRANKVGSGRGHKSSSSTRPSNSFVIMEAPNGKRYKVPENEISRYKKAGGKVVG
jgi:hypothetical protein